MTEEAISPAKCDDCGQYAPLPGTVAGDAGGNFHAKGCKNTGTKIEVHDGKLRLVPRLNVSRFGT